MNLKDISIGMIIRQRMDECGIEIERTCNFFKCSEEEVVKMYEAESLDTNTLLKWSKLLEYDFFRIYSQHLILYSPPGKARSNIIQPVQKTSLPQFRKNLYTMEVINFILELVNTGVKTKQQVINEYKIPKTTLYKWINKYNHEI
ncbi:transposase [Chryseobacterium sp. KBW03]|jgi:hypothetical protein|uniref:transposase n=1 Tax=Chryseobacterium sp. KBW03 TaxID=2153362 RepID=UPI000F5A0924|nr:transposase [Chryseobacterium sp. KBW03]RQO42554.1 transposase [Chryseobacterium sp. KBW03]